MIKRIDFSVIKVTGEDDNYPAAELNNQRPVAKGWMSSKFCSYPQVVIMRLETRARLCKFQVLSHPFSITSKMELHVGDVKKALPEVLQNVSWEKQGEICFSENYLTDYKARELRSARLDIIAKFIKLVMHQNHVNKFNLCNQVGIIAVNLLGEPIMDGGSIKTKYLTDDLGFSNRAKNVTMLDELPFNMYVDVEVAQLIRALDRKKQRAISDDRFVYAKKLKYAQNQLIKVGEKLGKLDIEKELAVEDEDYDRAHLKKEEIEKLRLDTYKRLNITALMEMEGKVIKENDMEDYLGLNLENNQGSKGQHSSKPPNEMLVPMIGNFVGHDDSVVPALTKGVKTQPSVFPGSDTETGNDLVLGKLTEKERREASLPIEVFGLPLVEKMYSKSFDQREEAMKELQSFLEKYQKKGRSHSPNDIIKAASFLIQKALCDKVFSIYTAALSILAMCFKSFIPAHQVSKIESSALVEKSMPEIMNKLGDTAPRLKNASLQYLTNEFPYSELENLQIIPLYVLSPLQNVLNVRLAQGRCELLEKMIKKYPPSSHSILSLSKVMPFLVDALQHPASSVRGSTERIILYLYEKDGTKVRKYIPFDSVASKRNIMHRRLLQEFDKIDKQKLGSKVKPSLDTKEKVSKQNFAPPVTQIATEDLSVMKTCIFCEEKNDKFSPEGLDDHYDKECLMLIRCSNCKQIVEIASLTEHLLEECESKSQYQQCPLCLEAIPSLNFDNHIKIRMCTMAKSSSEANHCPLCHKNIEPEEQGWRNHLMSDNGCAFNPRRKDKKNSKKRILKKKGKK
ncbi:centrosomal protein of 104 kDa [Trichonephila inaurata madagascariensis]|uniref:Centrosomal protein of 104 kDa n=1 Tax=Trichonephila inaurata madagascariensis TaxID=2747483 RepID=A0A8X6X2K7_9ARAC|nr:centrosomal protein of 104 kDa [Trichonephila inaurata madagascariensis]